MEKRMINPWQWQDERSYVQAVEVKHAESTLYVSGQAAISPEGVSSDESMEAQLILALQNLEQVISEAGYACSGIARLTIYTTSTSALWPHFGIFQDWVARHEVRTAITMLEVTGLFETLKVELEATVVK